MPGLISTVRFAWAAAGFAIAAGVIATILVIGLTWRTLGAIEVALPRIGFDALRELNVMIRDVTVLEGTVELAKIAPTSPESTEKLQEANDFAYIRFFRQDFSPLYPVFPALPSVQERVRRVVEEIDAILAAGRPYDSAVLADIELQLRAATQGLSQFYYTFGENTNKVLLRQQDVLSRFKRALTLFLGMLCTLGGTSVALLLNRIFVLKRIRHISTHDVLTGLPNRVWFGQVIAQMLQAKGGRPLALLIVDLDRFKEVNDTFGHPVGDLLLKEAASHLRAAVRPQDYVVRLAGDEFAVIAPDLPSPAAAAGIAARIVSEFSGTVVLAGHHIRLSASSGVAVFPRDGATVEELLAHADLALYAAKRAGRSRFELFTPALADELTGRMALESAIGRALREHEFTLVWQPQVNLSSHQVEAAEALIRWFDREKQRWVPPGDFIPIAENGPLIREIDAFVIRGACLEGAAIHAALGQPLRISVNVSAGNLEREEFPDELTTILHATGFPARSLELEITEGMLLQNREVSGKVIRRLSEIGVQLAVDDFGTGYSNLGYLADLEVHRLKIDRSFVLDLSESSRKFAIITAIVQFAHSLGLETVAEGVETPRQLEGVISAGCNLAQGFLFSPPLGAGQLVEWCAKQAGQRLKRPPALRLIANEAGRTEPG
jgi:diguanylate cyclase (GGDEF)-like protein